MGFTKVIFAIVFLIIAHPAYSLFRNYQKAKKVGLPIIVTPVSSYNPIWWIFGPLAFPIMARLPFGISDWAYFGDMFWTYRDQGRAHERLGPAFLMVTPGETNLVINDPKTVDDCLKKIGNFIKPPQIYQAIEIFGPNVDTVNGEAWQRHRRLTTPPFNEKNSGLVWKESLAQAKGMMAQWLKKGKEGVSDTSYDTLKLALHVLAGAGFGKSYDFDVGATVVPEGHHLSYRDALVNILNNMLLAIITSQIKAPTYLLPKALKKMRLAQAEFKQHMVEMVEQERAKAKGSNGGDNLMSVLVRANDVSQAEGKERYSLTDEELHGNLFIWNLAGHDTTARALHYAFYLLSVHLDVQEWLAEEIEEVLSDAPSNEWDYEKVFPQLKRCLALMYETLRLYGPVPLMTKSTANGPQLISIQEKEYIVPQDYLLSLNLAAIMASKQNWGPDASTWRPSRHIENGEFIAPAQGTFVAWAGGPRICPGKKFAQVEFVATIATALSKHRVYPVPLVGETEEGIRKRVMDVVADSDVGVSPTLSMNHPERVHLRWVKLDSRE